MDESAAEILSLKEKLKVKTNLLEAKNVPDKQNSTPKMDCKDDEIEVIMEM